MPLLVSLCLPGTEACAKQEGLAKVIAVLDGDTVLLMNTDDSSAPHLFYKLRLADIDAPEKNQVYGEQAQQALAQLVLKQHVRVTTVATDSYGRSIGWIALTRDASIENSVNAELVRRGWAWALSRGRSPYLREAQQEAQRERRGLWASRNTMPPWIWRKQRLPKSGQRIVMPAFANTLLPDLLRD